MQYEHIFLQANLYHALYNTTTHYTTQHTRLQLLFLRVTICLGRHVLTWNCSSA